MRRPCLGNAPVRLYNDEGCDGCALVEGLLLNLSAPAGSLVVLSEPPPQLLDQLLKPPAGIVSVGRGITVSQHRASDKVRILVVIVQVGGVVEVLQMVELVVPPFERRRNCLHPAPMNAVRLSRSPAGLVSPTRMSPAVKPKAACCWVWTSKVRLA